MRRISRPPLPDKSRLLLEQRQSQFVPSGKTPAEAWKSARSSDAIKSNILPLLKAMAGKRERCMYCEDSHGADIEHFRPKTSYPDDMFTWENLLLCCTECGRFKGDQFPLKDGLPLLVDPTAGEPWQFLDFDPTTGNIVARFDPLLGDWTAKGDATVEILHLNRREALASGCMKTYRRLKTLVESAMQQSDPDVLELDKRLREADDHGLLGWCFVGTGKNEKPFSTCAN